MIGVDRIADVEEKRTIALTSFAIFAPTPNMIAESLLTAAIWLLNRLDEKDAQKRTGA